MHIRDIWIIEMQLNKLIVQENLTYRRWSYTIQIFIQILTPSISEENLFLINHKTWKATWFSLTIPMNRFSNRFAVVQAWAQFPLAGSHASRALQQRLSRRRPWAAKASHSRLQAATWPILSWTTFGSSSSLLPNPSGNMSPDTREYSRNAHLTPMCSRFGRRHRVWVSIDQKGVEPARQLSLELVFTPRRGQLTPCCVLLRKCLHCTFKVFTLHL